MAAAKEFELSLSKEDFKFSSAHFVAHDGGRERLHGHNYRLRVVIRGSVGPDGYVIDFGEAKKAIRAVCKELDELFLLPTQSKTTSYSIIPGEEGRPSQIDLLVHRDGSRFSFPVDDVALLPLENSTVEELSRLLAGRIAERMGHEALKSRYVTSLTVGIAESPGQEAAFTLDLRPQLAANPTSQ